MQFAIENAVVRVEYTDGTTDELMLVPPVNWCPIEQDFVENAVAFAMPAVRPYRIGLNTGIVSRHLSATLTIRRQPLPAIFLI